MFVINHYLTKTAAVLGVINGRLEQATLRVVEIVDKACTTIRTLNKITAMVVVVSNKDYFRLYGEFGTVSSECHDTYKLIRYTDAQRFIGRGPNRPRYFSITVFRDAVDQLNCFA